MYMVTYVIANVIKTVAENFGMPWAVGRSREKQITCLKTELVLPQKEQAEENQRVVW